jgi:murein peptide amidase A
MATLLLWLSLMGHASEKRNFAEIEVRIQALPNVERAFAGKVQYGWKHYPIYSLVTPEKKGQRHNVLLSAGVHGDEPAGIYAVLEFLEKKASAYEDRFRFFVFPCVNPSGFEADKLENEKGENLNRLFKKDTPAKEAKIVLDQLEKWDRKFALTIDMHEIPPYWADEGFTAKDNPRTAYLYETQKDKSKRIGRAMIEGLPKDIEVSDWPKIYGDVAVKGLVSYPEGNLNPVYAEQTTLDGYLQGKFSAHTFTFETPIGWPLEKRVRAQLSWLETALKKYRKRN